MLNTICDFEDHKYLYAIEKIDNKIGNLLGELLPSNRSATDLRLNTMTRWICNSGGHESGPLGKLVQTIMSGDRAYGPLMR